ncbi:MAG: ATP synthase subunit C [Proteocatella sp.]
MKIVLAIMAFVVVGTIAVGARLYINGAECSKIKKTLVANISLFAPLAAGAILLMIPEIANAATATSADASGMGYLAAALSTGLATIGAGYAVGSVGSAALGAVSEDQKILGKTLIFVGLAEGIAIYGLIVSILILGRL